MYLRLQRWRHFFRIYSLNFFGGVMFSPVEFSKHKRARTQQREPLPDACPTENLPQTKKTANKKLKSKLKQSWFVGKKNVRI